MIAGKALIMSMYENYLITLMAEYTFHYGTTVVVGVVPVVPVAPVVVPGTLKDISVVYLCVMFLGTIVSRNISITLLKPSGVSACLADILT